MMKKITRMERIMRVMKIMRTKKIMRVKKTMEIKKIMLLADYDDHDATTPMLMKLIQMQFQ